MKKLNLGAGGREILGFEPRDAKTGDVIWPLPDEDASCDEIRASHVLEHFGHHQVQSVVNEWVRALKPGGVLKVAVPDFEKIASLYLKGAAIPTQGFVMGGQSDAMDYHKTIFDRHELTEVLTNAGLVGVTTWESETDDCASLPISLNLKAVKPDPARAVRGSDVGAVMSVPRLGFMDNYFAAFQALRPLGIELRKHTGAFWGQCLTRAMQMVLDEGKQWILAVDYDSVYTRRHVEQLLDLAGRYPQADAIAPIQAHRTKATALMTLRGADGIRVGEIERNVFDAELVPAATAHFGLTLIKVEALRRIKKPWFVGVPDENGEWGDQRTDDDIHFWRQWETAGNTLMVASRVAIGHAELMIRWPDENLQATYQHPSEFWQDGAPDNVWR